MLSFLNVRQVLKGYITSARGVNELVPWACPWDDQLVLTTDQGLLAAFEYEGMDAEGKSQAEIDQAVGSFERAFAAFRSDSFVWSIVDRRRSDQYPGLSDTRSLGGFVEGEWKAQILPNQYTNTYSLAVFQRSSTGSSGFLDMMDRIIKETGVGLFPAFLSAARTKLSVKESIRFNDRVVRAAKETLDQRLSELNTGLARIGLRRLSGDRLMGYLFNRINVASKPRDHVGMPRHLSQFLGTYLTTNSIDRLPKSLRFTDGVRTRHVGVISLKGWPDMGTFPGQLDFLTAVNGEVTVCHCHQFIDKEVAVKAMSSVERYNITASVPFLHRLLSTLMKQEPTKFDAGRLALAADAQAAKTSMIAEGKTFGFHCLTVLCYGDTEAEMITVRDSVMERISESNFVGRVEAMHQLSAFNQTLPGQWQSSIRWAHVGFANAADIAPIRTLQAGPSECEFFTKELQAGVQPVLISVPTDTGVPFNWDPFQSGAGHTAFIGPTRNGKTALVNMLLSIFKCKYPGARVIRLDKDYSGMIACGLGGGQHIDLRPDSGPGLRMCPIALVRDKRAHQFVGSWVRKLIESMRPDPLSPDEIDKLTEAVRNLVGLPDEMHTLTSLRASLPPSMGRPLDEWLRGGLRGGWFDNEPNDFAMGDNMCFEMKRLFDDPLVAELAMDYLFYLIEQSLDGRPMVINAEETWFFLRNKRFLARLEDFLRTCGKRNCALWITTQGAHELTADDGMAVLLEQLKNRVFLPNPEILRNRAAYEKLGLTEEQMVKISQAEPKRDYYIKTDTTARMAVIQIPQSVIPVITASAKALAAYAHHSQSGVEGWEQEYFNAMI